METSIVLIFLIALVALYFLPSVIALGRGTKARGLQFPVNLLFGWTAIGWLLALVWAASSRTQAQDDLEAKRHAEMVIAISKSA